MARLSLTAKVKRVNVLTTELILPQLQDLNLNVPAPVVIEIDRMALPTVAQGDELEVNIEFVKINNKSTMTSFQPKQRVRVARDHDFNKAVAPYPTVGTQGNVVTCSRTPQGKVAVRFSSKTLGYEDYKNNRYTILFIDEKALEPVK